MTSMTIDHNAMRWPAAGHPVNDSFLISLVVRGSNSTGYLYDYNSTESSSDVHSTQYSPLEPSGSSEWSVFLSLVLRILDAFVFRTRSTV